MESRGQTLEEFPKWGRKILGIGRNYRELAQQAGTQITLDPVVFMKPTSSYVQQGKSIKVPKNTDYIFHEVELGVVIGKTAKHVSVNDAKSCIGGYTVALDMTHHKLLLKLKDDRLPWAASKSFDTFTAVGKFITKEEIINPDDVQLWLDVNSVRKQYGNTSDMVFNVSQIVSYCSSICTLEPGDLILTGTPAGVGPVVSGDVITAGFENIGATIQFDIENEEP